MILNYNRVSSVWFEDNESKTFCFQNPSDKTKQNGSSNVQTEAAGKTDLRIEMPVPPRSDIHSENSPGTMTTSISRRPAEDSPLDYAYDNPAMSTTPSPHSTNKPHESTF